MIITRVGAVVIAICAILVGWLSYAVGVGSLIGQQAEESVLAASTYNPSPPIPLSLISVPALGLALLALTVIAWAFRGFSRAIWMLLFATLAVFASQLLKDSVMRPELLELGAPNTFPSGHMTVFSVLVAAILWALPASVRTPIALVGAALLSVVSWQLLEFGWHRPSDLIGAQALSVVAFAVASATRFGRSRGNIAALGIGMLNRVLRIILAAIAGVAVAAGVVLGSYAALQRTDSLMLTASEIVIVGVSAITTRVLLALAR